MGLVRKHLPADLGFPPLPAWKAAQRRERGQRVGPFPVLGLGGGPAAPVILPTQQSHPLPSLQTDSARAPPALAGGHPFCSWRTLGVSGSAWPGSRPQGLLGKRHEPEKREARTGWAQQNALLGPSVHGPLTGSSELALDRPSKTPLFSGCLLGMQASAYRGQGLQPKKPSSELKVIRGIFLQGALPRPAAPPSPLQPHREVARES